MLNLSNVLQFVIHGLYYSPLPEKQFVGYGHQCSLHVALQFRYKLYAIHKEPFEKTLDMPTMSQKPITKKPNRTGNVFANNFFSTIFFINNILIMQIYIITYIIIVLVFAILFLFVYNFGII